MDPPDFDLGEILANISDEDMKKISSLAQGFSGNSDGSTNKSNNQKSEDPSFPFDPEMLFRISEILERLNNSNNDPRCNLISALKPLLSPTRREKADRAIELLRLMSLLSMGDIFDMR